MMVYLKCVLCGRILSPAALQRSMKDPKVLICKARKACEKAQAKAKKKQDAKPG